MAKQHSHAPPWTKYVFVYRVIQINIPCGQRTIGQQRQKCAGAKKPDVNFVTREVSLGTRMAPIRSRNHLKGPRRLDENFVDIDGETDGIDVTIDLTVSPVIVRTKQKSYAHDESEDRRSIVAVQSSSSNLPIS